MKRMLLFAPLLALASCVSAGIDRGPTSPANPRAPAAPPASVARSLTEDPAPAPAAGGAHHHHGGGHAAH